jgi:hypothetical protein
LVDVREALPKGRDPSPSVAAFNKIFGMLHRGELLSVGCEVARNKGGAPKILMLWNRLRLLMKQGRGVQNNRFTHLEELFAIPGKNLAPL